MSNLGDAPVGVIIAAWNAAPTIGRAVASALAQNEVGEVVVVDDGSTDGTPRAAQEADDRSGRLRIIAQTVNRGPAAARNAALDVSSAPLLAILDADDFLLPGRFAPLLAQRDWDAIADNIAFIDEAAAGTFDSARITAFPAAPSTVGLAEFVLGNISRRGSPRGEMGFAKPVIRRSTLSTLGLRYDPRLRLGEDYALYARLLAAGGRFVRVRSCGYVAIERTASLSGTHDTADLAALLASDEELLARPDLGAADRAAVTRHAAHIRNKLHHRHVLDIRKTRGRWRALCAAVADPAGLPPLIGAVAADKAAAWTPAARRPALRYLFA